MFSATLGLRWSRGWLARQPDGHRWLWRLFASSLDRHERDGPYAAAAVNALNSFHSTANGQWSPSAVRDSTSRPSAHGLRTSDRQTIAPRGELAIAQASKLLRGADPYPSRAEINMLASPSCEQFHLN